MKKTSSTGVEMHETPADYSDAPQALISAAQRAVRAALLEHKRAGNPIAVWEDGKVVLIPPDKIEA